MKLRSWLGVLAVLILVLLLAPLWLDSPASRPESSGPVAGTTMPAASPPPAEAAAVVAAPLSEATGLPAKSTLVSRTAAPAWQLTSPTGGLALEPLSTAFRVRQLRGEVPKGRSASVTPVSHGFLATLQSGDVIPLPLLGGDSATGRVQLVARGDDEWIRVAGALEGGRGSFQLAANGKTQAALIQLPAEGLAYEIETLRDGQTLLAEKPLSAVLCFSLPRPDNEPTVVPDPDRSTIAATPPSLSSRPDAVAVIYLDFDGEVVTDPAWNNGVTINAAASPLTEAEMTEVWNRVKEDYAPFNIDVTTRLSRYTSAPVGRRTRVIITPTTTAAPGAGGVAYLYSFSLAGDGLYSATIPAWVFNSTPRAIAEAVSHEAGHTFGLQHDGRLSPVESYYQGHGSGAVGWGPIMGATYTRELSQWSKGEYANANQTEDDIAIIAGDSNGFGFVTDEAGGTRTSAAVLNAPGGVVNQAGIITQSGDTDFYTFNVAAGRVTLNATPATVGANLDLALELQDAAGQVVATSNPDLAIDGAISVNVPVGTFFLRVRGTGRGDVLGTGYTAYGSVGAYRLTGSLPGTTQAPVITSATAVAAAVGQPLFYQLLASGNPTSYAITSGTLPAGLSFDAGAATVTGQPLSAGVSTVVFTATNAIGAGTRSVTFTVGPALTLEQALDGAGLVWTTTGGAAWLPQNAITDDGSDAGQSGLIGNSQSSRVSTTVAGPATVTFRWRADTEANRDIVRLKLDGVVQASLSGRTEWVSGTVNVSSGSHTLEWDYTKDASVSEGADAVWLDRVAVGPPLPPVVTSRATAAGTVGIPFTYQLVANNSPSSYQVILGTLPAGLTLDTATGAITGTPTTPQTTVVTLGATSSVGTGTLAITFSISESNLALAVALDTPGRTWTTSATTGWLGQTEVTYDGVDAARSRVIGDRLTTTMETIVAGPAVLSFRWKVDSEESYDFLTVRDNGVVVAAISGLKDWTERSINLAAGNHTIRWSYEKDIVRAVGADAGWVDQVTVTASTSRVLALSGDLAFGEVAVGSSATRTLTLTNLGNSTLNVTGITYPAGFSGNAAGQLPPGTSGTVTVTFRPTTLTAYAGVATVASDATSGASTRSLSGIGVTPAPVNDRLNFAVNLLGTSLTATANSSSATRETGEPDHAGLPGGSSVWWRWTANTTGPVAINTIGSNFDTLLAVYTGAAFGSLVSVASNDEDGGSGTSSLTFNAVAGTAYLIAVDGFFGDAGDIVLNLATVPEAPNDRFSAATVLTGTTAQSISSNGIASRETDEPNHGGQFFGRSLWWTWTAPSNGRLLINTNGSSFDTLLAIYTGPLVSSLTPIASDDQSGYGNASALSIAVQSGTTYRIAVDSKGVVSGTVVLNLQLVTPPANDGFSGATLLSGNSVRLTGTTLGATRETGEPLHAGVNGGSSIWWKWTSPDLARVTVSTEGSSFDTTLAIYAGTSVTNLVSLGSNDDETVVQTSSRVDFTATGGTTYWIAVDGYEGASGSFRLALDAIPPPVNDTFAAASELTGLAVQSGGSNAGATKEPGEPNHAAWTGGTSVWWKWTAPSATRVAISTAGSNFDTLLAVYTGTSVGSLSTVAFNDEDGPVGVDTSAVAFDAVGGTTYWIAVDGFGAATGLINLSLSGVALLAPTITAQPAPFTAATGENAVFTVAVSGTTPFTFQWRKDGVTLPGAVSATLAFVNVQPAQAGAYSVIVTNAIGSVTSSAATLTVTAAATAPVITTQPLSQTVLAGQPVTFTVVAGGTAPLSYQWSKGGVALPDATSASLVLAATQASDAGSYTVVVTNVAGSVTSSPAVLTVNPAVVAPTITTQPVGLTVVAGQPVSFSVIAAGTAPLTYQWFRDAVPVAGATAATFSITAVQAANAGVYTVAVTNVAGTVTSAGATLAVSPAPIAPIILTPPSSQTVSVGQSVTLSVVVTGTPPFTYQWKQNGANIPGTTASSFVLAQAQLSDGGGYSVAVTNAVGTVTSLTATLTVTPAATAPTLLQGPVSQAVTEGASVSFTVSAAGTAPMTYQWSRDGVALPGATLATLTLGSVRLADAGAYSVVVTNAVGSVTSGTATLQVSAAVVGPTLTTSPASLTVNEGQPASFTVVASGTAPLAYVWSKNGTPIGGATTATLTIASAQLSDQGSYTVTVSNAAGTITSPAAVLTVDAAIASRISNVSVRTTLAAEQTLFVGLTMSGGEKPILVRAVGPGLAAFGVPDTMPDPRLALYDGSVQIEANDNWGGGAPLLTAFASVGAFALPGDSKDAALVRSVQGGRTVQISGQSAGGVLVEGYDAGTGNTARLTNVSARNRVGTGGDILIAGITIAGTSGKTVVIRAVGPTLAAFGVPGVLADPKLEVYSGATKIDENDSWSTSLAAQFARVGAFALVEGSKDAALVVTLPPGGYTIQVRGADGGTGEALVEVYELQP
jgi:hypothetical protein